MKSFQFRLQSVQKIRESVRDERREALAQAYEADRLLKQQQEIMAQEMQELRKQTRSSSAGQVNVDRLLEIRRYEMVLQSQSAAVKQQQDQLQEEIERRRQALADADREVRVLEKLYDRQRAEYLAEMQRREIHQLDEAASRRYSSGSTS